MVLNGACSSCCCLRYWISPLFLNGRVHFIDDEHNNNKKITKTGETIRVALRVLETQMICVFVKQVQIQAVCVRLFCFLSPAFVAEVEGDLFSHVGPLTFSNPSDEHFAGSERSSKNKGYSGRVSLESLSPRHTRDACKSCCPLVMTEHEEGEAAGAEGKNLFSQSPPLSSSAFLSFPLALSLSHTHYVCVCALLLRLPRGGV